MHKNRPVSSPVFKFVYDAHTGRWRHSRVLNLAKLATDTALPAESMPRDYADYQAGYAYATLPYLNDTCTKTCQWLMTTASLSELIPRRNEHMNKH